MGSPNFSKQRLNMHCAIEKYSEEILKSFALGTCEREEREKYFPLQASA